LIVCGAHLGQNLRTAASSRTFSTWRTSRSSHTDILGAEPHTEVLQYTTEIRRDVDEVWATNCQFFQPQAALSAAGGS